MYSESLFLGFQVDASLEKMLLNLDPAIRTLFCNGGDYLKELEEDGEKYLGKIISPVIDLTSLDLLNSNILSLKDRLFPNMPKTSSSLWLLAIIHKNS